ncbi:MAG: hypothetical protein AAGI37_13025 [Planctomycetota bacterium]
MPGEFSQVDWSFIKTRLDEVSEQIAAKGATVLRPVRITPPISSSQITEFESATGLRVPPELSSYLTEYSGGWEFYWSLTRAGQTRESVNPPKGCWLANFGGGPFLLHQEDTSLLAHFTEMQRFFEEFRPDDKESEMILRHSIPLTPFWAGVDGDYCVLRLDTDPAEIVYADHEAGWHIRPEHKLGVGFRDFLVRWAEVAFPGFEYLTHSEVALLTETGSSERERNWLEWLSGART